jgi:hypothetical protein
VSRIQFERRAFPRAKETQMRILMLGACVALLAGAATAQPYDQDQPAAPNAYSDQSGPGQYDNGQYDNGQYDNGQYDNGQYGGQYDQGDRGADQYGADAYRDNGYANDRGWSGPYREPRESYGDRYGYRMGGAHYTGRLGASWRDPEGRYCVYRELTWTGENGAPAYKWEPSCRY